MSISNVVLVAVGIELSGTFSTLFFQTKFFHISLLKSMRSYLPWPLSFSFFGSESCSPISWSLEGFWDAPRFIFSNVFATFCFSVHVCSNSGEYKCDFHLC
jgi:hypothetical protein